MVGRLAGWPTSHVLPVFFGSIVFNQLGHSGSISVTGAQLGSTAEQKDHRLRAMTGSDKGIAGKDRSVELQLKSS